MMHYRGKVFRPPFEERSLLIEATVGCSRDKCAFCSLYHDTPFSPSPMEDIEDDIRFIGRNRTRFKRVFLVGGDPFCLPYNRLKWKVPEEKKERLKSLQVVSTDERASWLIDYWCGKDIRGLIQMPFSRHWIMHIEACLKIKNKIHP